MMIIDKKPYTNLFLLACLICFSCCISNAWESTTPTDLAQEILRESDIAGGVIVHLGSGDGRLTAALCAHDGYLVQGLDRNAARIQQARSYIQSLHLYGKVSVDLLTQDHLPYVDNLVNLVIAEDSLGIPKEEMLRVLCPDGIAWIKEGQKWTQIQKPRPKEIDEWTHYLHDASGNPVAHDSIVGPPRHLQWVGSPRWSRHHDHMSSLSALVSSGERIFYIMDEGPIASIELPPAWSLVARDAFNGKTLWKRPIEQWYTHLWPLKSGPAQLPRRLVAEGDTVYVTLGIKAGVSALDAKTGKTIREFTGTQGTEELIVSEGVLYALVNPNPPQSEYESIKQIRTDRNRPFWDKLPRLIKAFDAETGELLWRHESVVVPLSLVSDSQHVYFHNGERIISLDSTKGKEQWHSEPISLSEEIFSFFAPTLIVYKDVLLFAGGERAGQQRGEWYTEGVDTMTALSTQDGKVLWRSYHPPSGYRSPEDVLVVDDLVWTGETTSGRALGLFKGRDLHNGNVRREFVPDVDTYWFHHRCYRSKATDRFLLTSRSGTEFIDPQTSHWDINHWVRGACLYGVMPANGLLYAPPHPCACYLEAKLNGFNALAPETSRHFSNTSLGIDDRLIQGPAYGKIQFDPATDLQNDWPTYRSDPSRSGYSHARINADIEQKWKTEIGGKLTSLVVAEGIAWVASVEDHTLHALDASSGKEKWTFTAGGRIDSPPTIYQGHVLFGSADGWVYCLRASDGELAWRFLAAPNDYRLTSYEQIESVWPVHGSVLVKNDVLYCVAGRSMFLDGGMRLWRIDPKTGEGLSETILDNLDPATGKDLQSYIRWLNMPPALPDILSSERDLVYMRSQPFSLDGKRLPLRQFPQAADADKGAPEPVQNPERAHLFSPTGFVDDTWFHRSYWMYGDMFVSGWCGYYLAGKVTPAGRALVFDEDHVYGFGRNPKFYRWTTPLEYQLFSSSKHPRVIKTKDRKGQANQIKQIEYQWTTTVPLLVRAMVLADSTLFIAGPPDLINEEKVLGRLDDTTMKKQLIEQHQALEGKKGALLWVVSAADHNTLAEYQLDSPPVMDGMAVAHRQLYMATVDGHVICFQEKKG